MTDDELMTALYDRLKRRCQEGSLSEAVRYHAQACGMVAFVFNVHPDTVARAVAHTKKEDGLPLTAT